MSRGRPPAADRLRRLLVLIPWVAARGRVPVAEVAARFGITVRRAVKDLELAACIGVPPYTPDALVDLYLDGDDVVARPGPVFRRPPRLSAAEGVSVLAAGRALLDVPGADETGALASALDKLERALGGRVAVDVAPPPLLDLVRRAAAEGRRLAVEYFSAYRDERTERIVDPLVVYHRRGRWYVDVFDHGAGAERHFRVDRILAAGETGERFEPARREPPDDVYDPGPGARRVVVLVPAAGRWVVETYPVEWAEEPDGRLRVTFTVVGERWLERLLLRLGPDAEVVDPPALADTGRLAARRILARYRPERG